MATGAKDGHLLYPFDVQTSLNWPDVVFYCLTADNFTSLSGTLGGQWVKVPFK